MSNFIVILNFLHGVTAVVRKEMALKQSLVQSRKETLTSVYRKLEKVRGVIIFILLRLRIDYKIINQLPEINCED